MANFKKGTLVRKVVPDIVGEVRGARLDGDLQMEYLVAFKDAEGVDHERWFGEAELETEHQTTSE